jgi:hypothetical protein
VPTDDPLGPPLTVDRVTRVNPASTFEEYWNGPTAKRDLGATHYVSSNEPMEAIVRASDGTIKFRPVNEINLIYTIGRNSWLGHFQPKDCRGLIDYLDENAFKVSYLPLSELPVKRDDSWQEIDNPEKVAVSARGTVVTTERYMLVHTTKVQEVAFKYLGAKDPQSLASR